MARRFEARRRIRRWTSLPGIAATITSAGTTGGSQLSFTTPETVVRMLGTGIVMFGATVPVASDAVSFCMAIGVVSMDAADVGASALPDPADEPEYPWLWWKCAELFATDATANRAGNTVGGTFRYEFDIKSQRIIRPGHSLIYVAQYVDTAGTPEVEWQTSPVRVLVLES